MLDHLGIPAVDVEAAVRFYLSVFEPLGFREAHRIEQDDVLVVGFSAGDGPPQFWVAPAKPEAADSVREELHIAFAAPDRATVDAVHEAAIAAGAEVLHAPREWPEYHPGYYAVFVRDLDGNNVEAVDHGFPAPPA